jgi:prepilin-type N-terminal cleavage/methylation domain-containing protein
MPDLMCYLRQRNSKQGFTLLEIIIVVTLIAILVAAAVPGFRKFYLQSLEEDAITRFIANLKTAQNLAVINRVQMEVRFDTEKGLYQIVPPDELLLKYDTTPKYARAHQLAYGMKFTKIEINTGEDTEDTSDKINSLFFYANGSSDGAKISISSPQTEKSTNITVKKTTGMVIIDDDNKDQETQGDTTGQTQ